MPEYPILFRDDFDGSGGPSSNWKAAITGSVPTWNESGGSLAIDGGNTTSANSRKAYMVDTAAVPGVLVKGKRIRLGYLQGTPASQFPTLWGAINTDLTTIAGGITLVPINTDAALRRRFTITSSSGPSGTTLLGNDTSPLVVNGTGYILEIDDLEVVAATSSRWIARVLNIADGSLFAGPIDSGTVNSALTDTAAYPPGVSIQTSGTFYWFEVLDIGAPRITDQPNNATISVGQAGNFVVVAEGGEAGTSPGLQDDITYQWEESADGETGWTDVSTGTGYDSDDFDTATQGSPGTFYFRCRIEDTGNSRTHYSDVVTLTVSSSTGPVLSNVETATPANGAGHSQIVATFNVALTLDGDETDFPCTKNGVPITPTLAAVGGNDLTLTFAERFKSSDVILFNAAADALSNGGNGNDAISDEAVDNLSPTELTVAVAAPYDELYIRRGVAGRLARVVLTRTSHTANVTVEDVIGLPANVAYSVVSDFGAGSVALIRLTAAAGAAVDLSDIELTVEVSDSYDTREADMTIHVQTNTRGTNRFGLAVGPLSSTGFYIVDDGATPIFFDSLTGWDVPTLAQNDGGFGITGSTPADWQPGSTNGYLCLLLNWLIENNYYEVWSIPLGSNKVTEGAAWSTFKAEVAAIHQAVIDQNITELCTAPISRFDAGQMAGGTLTGIAGLDLTLNNTFGTLSDEVNDFIDFGNGNGSDLMFRRITNLAGNVVTIASAFPFTPSGNYQCRPGGYDALIRTDYAPGMKAQAEGGAEEISSIYGGRLLWFDNDDLFTTMLDYMRPDRTHSSVQGNNDVIAPTVQGNIDSYLLENAALELSGDATLEPDGVGTVIATVTGVLGAGTNPAPLVAGTFAITADTTGGAEVDPDTGEVTAGPDAGEIEVTYTMDKTPYGAAGPLSETWEITVESASVPVTGSPTIASAVIDAGGTTGLITFSEPVTGTGGFQFFSGPFPVLVTLSGSGATRTATFERTIYEAEQIYYRFDQDLSTLVDTDDLLPLRDRELTLATNNSEESPSGNWAFRAKGQSMRRGGVRFESGRWQIVASPTAAQVADPNLIKFADAEADDPRFGSFPVLNPEILS